MAVENVNKYFLIELVENEPRLWDHRIKAYHCRDIKSELWDDIGKKLSISGKLAQNQWENLRDSYRRMLKKRKGRKGSCKWRYFECMAFIRDVIIIRDPDNLSEISVEEEKYAVSSDAVFEEFSPTAKSDSFLVNESKRKLQPSEEVHQLKKQKPQLSEESMQMDDVHDEDHMFLMSLHKNIGELDCLEKLSLKIEIMTCVKKYLERKQGSSS